MGSNLHYELSSGVFQFFFESGYLNHEIFLSSLLLLVEDEIIFIYSLDFRFFEV